MKALSRYMAIALSVLAVVSLTACSDNDDIGDSYQWDYPVVGEWYQDLGIQTDEIQQVCVSKYNSDGSISGFIATAMAMNWNYTVAEGTYRVEGKKLYENLLLNGSEKDTYNYDIKSVGKYDLVLYNNITVSDVIYHRIVDTYYLEVGETDVFGVNDPDFIPLEYTSNDDLVATVSPGGTIEAVRAGTAYLSAISSSGTAVIRVVVTNPVTGIDDFLAYMGENISVATKAYGGIYEDIDFQDDSGRTMRHYYLIDNQIQEIGFIYDTSGIVEDISFAIRDPYMVDGFTKTCKTIYKYKTEIEDYLYFQTPQNSRNVIVAINTSKGIIELFYENDDDPIAMLDKLIDMTATEAAAALGYEMTESELARGRFDAFPDSGAFWKISVTFNKETLEITGLSLYGNDSLTYDEVYNWYAQHYTATGKTTGFQFSEIDPVTFSMTMIMVTGSDGAVSITYLKI